MPRRVLESPSSFSKSPTPFSPGEVDVNDLKKARAFWYDVDENLQDLRDVDEATQDLRDVLGCQTPTKLIRLPDWIPAFEARCLSSASTTATATSPPPQFSGITPASSPDRDYVACPDLDYEIESQPNQQPQFPPGALDKSSWLQARKVFIGGIPQTVDQNGLYHMFSKVGKVKKAWLQLFHNDRSASQAPTAKKHRGFGFVIFYERKSIDELLGEDFSRFVCFGDNLKFEVKRSVGKTTVNFPDEQPASEITTKPVVFNSRTSPAASQAWQSTSPVSPGPVWQNASPAPSQSQVWQSASPPAPQVLQSASPAIPQSWQNHQSASPAIPQSWQDAPGQTYLVGFQTFVNLPCVPPFPFGESSLAQWLPNTSPSSSSLAQTQPQDLNCQFLPNVLLDAFAGQAPPSKQELNMALLEAMPEHYDD